MSPDKRVWLAAALGLYGLAMMAYQAYHGATATQWLMSTLAVTIAGFNLWRLRWQADPRRRIENRDGVLWIAGKATLPLAELHTVVVHRGYFSLHQHRFQGTVPELYYHPAFDDALTAHLNAMAPHITVLSR